MFYVHGILVHLAVCNALCKKPENQLECLETPLRHKFEESAVLDPDPEEDEEFSTVMDMTTSGFVSDKFVRSLKYETSDINLSETINRVTKIVRMFKISPMKN